MGVEWEEVYEAGVEGCDQFSRGSCLDVGFLQFMLVSVVL